MKVAGCIDPLPTDMRKFSLSTIVFLLAGAGAVACSDSAGPDNQRQMRLTGIQVSARAATTDTIRVSFLTFSRSCGYTNRIIAVESPADGVTRFSASSEELNFCGPTTQVAPVPVVYVIPPPHKAPYTLRFAEPDEADSVRVVAAQ
jgi:hypothetical protein